MMKIGNLEVHGIVYTVKNLLNSKVYIGITSQEYGFKGRYDASGNSSIERVYNYHMRVKNRNPQYTHPLLSSINKYGFDAFEVNEILDVAFSYEELTIKEMTYIQLFNSYKNGYNQTIGGEGRKGKQGENHIDARPIYCLNDGNRFGAIVVAEEYYNLNRGTIRHYLSGAQKSAGTLEDGTRLVWSYEEDYLRLSPEEIEAKIIEANKDWRLGSANSRARAIVCLNTREIFSTAKEASDKYGVERGNLSGRLSSKKPKSLGSLNGEKLTWRYLEDYNKMSEEDILEFIRVANEGNKGKNNPSAKSVICLNNLKIYDTMKEAEADTTAKGAEISNCCRGKKKTSKSYSWMYLSDYNKIKDMNMTIDELHKWKKNKYQKK